MCTPKSNSQEMILRENDSFAELVARFTASFAADFLSLSDEGRACVVRYVESVRLQCGSKCAERLVLAFGRVCARVGWPEVWEVSVVRDGLEIASRWSRVPDNFVDDTGPWKVPEYPPVKKWVYVPVPRPPKVFGPKARRKLGKRGKKKLRQEEIKKRVKAQKQAQAERLARARFQSGMPAKSHRLSRAERDKARAEQAKHDAKIRAKNVPKEDREKAIKDRRDKRNPAFQSGFEDLLAIASSATTIAAVGAVSSVATQFFMGATRAANSAAVTADFVSTFVAQLSAYAANIRAAVGDVLWKVPMVMIAFYAAYVFRDAPVASIALLGSSLSVLFGKEMWAAIAKFFPDGNIRLQSGMSETLLSQAPKLLATAMTFSVFAKPHKDVVGELAKRIAMFDRVSTGWEAFLTWFLKSFEDVFNYLRATFNLERVSLVTKMHVPMREWCESVDQLLTGEAIQREPVDSGVVDQMVQLIAKGGEYKSIYMGTPLGRMVEVRYQELCTRLLPYQGSLTARNNFRVEPVMMTVYGAPGIGKTLMATQLSAAILLESGILKGTQQPDGSFRVSPDDIKKEIWQKGTSEYWNGYAGQAVLVMDDAFQMRVDPTDKENEMMSIIRMVSSWSFPLNFADLPSKGKIYFGSKFIYATTNMPSIDNEARNVIHEPEAVFRRMHTQIRMRVAPDFALPDGKLDYHKFVTECASVKLSADPLLRFPWHVWQACDHNFLTGASTGEWRDFSLVVRNVANTLKERIRGHACAERELDDFISGYGGSVQQISLQSGFFTKPVFEKPSWLQWLGLELYQPIKSSSEMLYLKTNPLMSVSAMARQLKEYYARGNTVRKVLLTGGVALALAGGAFLLTEILKNLWGAFCALFGRKAKEQSNRPIREKVRRQAAVPKASAQALADPVADNTYANTYKMRVDVGGDSVLEIGQVLFVVDTLAVMPAHFRHHLVRSLNEEAITKESKIELAHSVQTGQRLEFTVGWFLELQHHIDDTKDVMFVQFKDVRAHRNIRGSFITERDIEHVKGAQGRLDICSSVDSKGKRCPSWKQVQFLPSLKYVAQVNIEGKLRKRLFQYTAGTSVGDCGAPLSLLDGRSFSGRSVIGIHVAGNTDYHQGYSTIVTREMVDAACERFKTIQDQFLEDLKERNIEYQCGNVMWTNSDDSFLPICNTTKTVNLCPKTSYYVTDMFGNLGPYNHFPAPLSPVWRKGELVYPMRNAVAPYGKPPVVFEDKLIPQAVYLALKPLLAKIKDCTRREFSFEEAVLGIPEAKFRSIPRGTSSGFPYVFDVRNGKKEFFGDGQDYDLSGALAQELKKRVEHVNSQAAKGVRLAHVFVDTLKDELRSEQKVEAVATRLISAAPLDYLIAWRMKFGAFGAAVMRNPVVTGLAPGISCTQDWTVLAELLRSKGDHVFDGDFKSFDSSQQSTILGEIFEHINRWYGGSEDEAMARRVLWLELQHSRHIGGAGVDQCHIYQWNRSLPSGHPFTTIVNSIYSLTVIIASYMHATGDLTGFWDHVMAVVYGDDNVVNVDDATIGVFNQRVLAQQLLQHYGMVYTAGDKTAELRESMTVSEIAFLKRKFVESPMGWLSPLEPESFLFTHYWCKNRKLERKIQIDVLENALEELSQHSAEMWAKYAPTIIKCLEERAGGTRALPFQDQYLMLIRSRADNWY